MRSEMKTIGLLGGMSWESTVVYYRLINEGIKNRLGGLHSAKIILYSVDLDPIEKLVDAGDWEKTAGILSDAALSVQSAGADCLLICCNTVHRIAPQIEKAIQIPLLHIVDTTADALVRDGIRKIGLLGTTYTMEQDFYKGRLNRNYGVNVLVPEPGDRNIVHEIIVQELCMGQVTDTSRKEYLRVIDDLAGKGAEAIILGCTEIGLLISQHDTRVKLYDTTTIHAEKGVDYALQNKI